MAFALVGYGCVTAGGYLGGHLVFARGVNVNRTAWRRGPRRWTDVLADAELAAGEHRRVPAGSVSVLLVRDVTVDTVGPSWGQQVSGKARTALVVFLIAISIYITLRFEWKMALATLAACAAEDFGLPRLERIALVPHGFNIDRTADRDVLAGLRVALAEVVVERVEPALLLRVLRDQLDAAQVPLDLLLRCGGGDADSGVHFPNPRIRRRRRGRGSWGRRRCWGAR